MKHEYIKKLVEEQNIDWLRIEELEVEIIINHYKEEIKTATDTDRIIDRIIYNENLLCFIKWSKAQVAKILLGNELK